MIKFNMITMKNGEINIEEKKDLSKALTQISEGYTLAEISENWCPSGDKSSLQKKSIRNHAKFTKTKKKRAMELDSHWYSTPDSNTFFTADLEQMKDIITDECKRDKILQRLGEGFKFGTFRRFKTQQPFLVKAYKTRKGAQQNTFWRNH